MRKWILLIFSINDSLDKRCENLDKKIEKLSLSSAVPAGKLYAGIVALNNIKADLINLRVLYNLMAESLCGDDLLIIQNLAKKGRGGIRGMNGASSKHISGIFSACEYAMANAGYNSRKLEQIYPHYLGGKKQHEQSQKLNSALF